MLTAGSKSPRGFALQLKAKVCSMYRSGRRLIEMEMHFSSLVPSVYQLQLDASSHQSKVKGMGGRSGGNKKREELSD